MDMFSAKLVNGFSLFETQVRMSREVLDRGFVYGQWLDFDAIQYEMSEDAIGQVF